MSKPTDLTTPLDLSQLSGEAFTEPSAEGSADTTPGTDLLQSIGEDFILVCSSPDCDGVCLHNSSEDGLWRATFRVQSEDELVEFSGGPQVKCQKCNGWQDRTACGVYLAE